MSGAPATGRALAALRWLGWYALAWAPFVPVMAFLIAFGSQGALDARTAIEAGFWSVAWAATLGLGVVAIVRAVPWRGRLTATFAAAHVAGALAYGACWIGGIWFNLAADGTAPSTDAWRAIVGWQFMYGVLIFVVVAASCHVRAGIAQARALRERLAATEALRTRAELEALRGRLDPHFLFNTLHSLRALVRRDASRAEEAIDRLAALLRATLEARREGARDDVTLREELAFVDDYLALETLRLGDRLRIVRDVDAGALDAELPAFSIQPLVENAIVHAIAPRGAGGTLALRVAAEGDAVRVTVRDDGPGADPAAVARATGVGLDTVRRRVVAGAGRRLDVETAPGTGFAVHLVLPRTP